MFQHTVDSMEQFAHCSAVSLEQFLAISHEMSKIILDMSAMLLGGVGMCSSFFYF
ncbi:MAG: hypothetical protein WAW61_17825 [Methylococcaceae bacterium]